MCGSWLLLQLSPHRLQLESRAGTVLAWETVSPRPHPHPHPNPAPNQVAGPRFISNYTAVAARHEGVYLDEVS